jgi:hypothetical protein
MDQYVSLLLLYMFNPICTSLRSLQQASELHKVQKKLGVPRASLGSLSEAATVFDSRQMVEVIAELGKQLQPIAVHDKLKNLPGTLTAVDGTLLKALPKITWALWIDEQHKAVRTTSISDSQGVPYGSLLIDGNGNEDGLAAHLQAGGFTLDRGYAKYELRNRFSMPTVPSYAASETITSPKRSSRGISPEGQAAPSFGIAWFIWGQPLRTWRSPFV